MGIIRQLTASVINQIAAGEVVERPASAVKELLENAIDAGATRIELSVERGGKDLIRVADNGHGMAPEDLPLAFTPHATSKLAEAEDLFRVATLGFRGEALAAIAEISKVRCQSRRAEAAEGTELAIDFGVAGPLKSCGCPVGTVIEVRNLFANTPVRRTFLKSDSTEAGHVAETFSRLALAHPTVHFTYRSAGKLVHDLPAVTGVKERIAIFFGRELADSLIWIESRVEAIHLWGYVAHPSQSRSSAKTQFLFVGGRFVRDRSLAHALAEAYRGLLMVGRLPVAFLHLDIPADQVDVNVHPTKVEVRFRDGQRIYSQLLAAVRQTFLASDLHARLQAKAEPPAGSGLGTGSVGGYDPAPQAAFGDGRPQAGAGTGASSTARYQFSTPGDDRQAVASWFAPNTPPSFQPYPDPGYAGGPQPRLDNLPTYATAASETPFNELDPSPGPEEPAAPDGAGSAADMARPSDAGDALLRTDGPLKALQVHDSYLIAETSEGMMVIDQHALHERILYEELRIRVQKGKMESQRFLVPMPVDLSAAEASSVLEQREVLDELGIEVEAFGGDTVLITSAPVMLAAIPADRLLRDLADHFRSRPLPPTKDALLADLLHMVACKAAVKAGQRLTPEEVAALLRGGTW